MLASVDDTPVALLPVSVSSPRSLALARDGSVTCVPSALSPEQRAALDAATLALADGNKNGEVRTIVDQLLLSCPGAWEVHFLAGKLCVAESRSDQAVWHAFMALVHVDERATADRVLHEVSGAAKNVCPN